MTAESALARGCRGHSERVCVTCDVPFMHHCRCAGKSFCREGLVRTVLHFTREMATLRELREKLVMTQAELAFEAGVGRMTVIRIEGNRPLRYRPSTIRKLARVLKVKPQAIDLPPRA